jgi:Bacterial Ig-like domain (group 3)
LTTTTLGVGSHSLSATYTPANSALYNPSTSASTSLTVKAPAATTATTLATAPVSPVTKGTSVTLTASLTPAGAVGSVEFLDGATVLGSHAVTSGTATLTVTTLAVGSHSLSATFVPTDATAYKGSTSTKHTFVVTAAPAVTTTTVLDVTPTTTAVHGDAVKLKATVTPTAAAGKVQFLDGTAVLATTTVSSGVASFTTSALSVADHTLSAKFVPTSTAAYTTSKSASVDLKVTASATPPPAAKLSAKTSTGKVLATGVTLERGEKITVTGSGFDAAEKVTITVHSTPVGLGTVVSNGVGAVVATVVVPSSLAAGSHTLTLAGASTSGVFAFKIAATTSGSGSGSGVSGSSGSSGSSGGDPSLPFTGANIVAPGSVGLLLLVIGGALVAGTRQRRRSLAVPAPVPAHRSGAGRGGRS